MRTRTLALLGAAFLLSGASALVYQVAWQRMLALGSGASVYSITLIVAAFMAGLGLGSERAPVSARVAPRQALPAFAGLEIGIGLFGAASPWLFHDLLYHRAAPLYESPSTAGLVHFPASWSRPRSWACRCRSWRARS